MIGFAIVTATRLLQFALGVAGALAAFYVAFQASGSHSWLPLAVGLVMIVLAVWPAAHWQGLLDVALPRCVTRSNARAGALIVLVAVAFRYASWGQTVVGHHPIATVLVVVAVMIIVAVVSVDWLFGREARYRAKHKLAEF